MRSLACNSRKFAVKHHAHIDHSWSLFSQSDVACSFYPLKVLFCRSHFHYSATRPGKCILPSAPARCLTRGPRPAVCVKVLTYREGETKRCKQATQMCKWFATEFFLCTPSATLTCTENSLSDWSLGLFMPVKWLHCSAGEKCWWTSHSYKRFWPHYWNFLSLSTPRLENKAKRRRAFNTTRSRSLNLTGWNFASTQ